MKRRQEREEGEIMGWGRRERWMWSQKRGGGRGSEGKRMKREGGREVYRKVGTRVRGLGKRVDMRMQQRKN